MNAPSFCTDCGAALPPGVNFCPQCGRALAAAPAPAPPVPPAVPPALQVYGVPAPQVYGVPAPQALPDAASPYTRAAPPPQRRSSSRFWIGCLLLLFLVLGALAGGGYWLYQKAQPWIAELKGDGATPTGTSRQGSGPTPDQWAADWNLRAPQDDLEAALKKPLLETPGERPIPDRTPVPDRKSAATGDGAPTADGILGEVRKNLEADPARALWLARQLQRPEARLTPAQRQALDALLAQVSQALAARAEARWQERERFVKEASQPDAVAASARTADEVWRAATGR